MKVIQWHYSDVGHLHVFAKVAATRDTIVAAQWRDAIVFTEGAVKDRYVMGLHVMPEAFQCDRVWFKGKDHSFRPHLPQVGNGVIANERARVHHAVALVDLL